MRRAHTSSTVDFRHIKVIAYDCIDGIEAATGKKQYQQQYLLEMVTITLSQPHPPKYVIEVIYRYFAPTFCSQP